VDRIASYWRWQESIAKICAEEVDRLSARRKSAEARVTRLKNMLISFMLTREQKKLDGDKASIALQPNGNPSGCHRRPAPTRGQFSRDSARLSPKTELTRISTTNWPRVKFVVGWSLSWSVKTGRSTHQP
jgi:nucleotidyltransferase/DNA polymerase involved in DNA repair